MWDVWVYVGVDVGFTVAVIRSIIHNGILEQSYVR